jgi:hypothetical protein
MASASNPNDNIIGIDGRQAVELHKGIEVLRIRAPIRKCARQLHDRAPESYAAIVLKWMARPTEGREGG